MAVKKLDILITQLCKNPFLRIAEYKASFLNE